MSITVAISTNSDGAWRGGRLMQQLLAQVIQPSFSNEYLNQQHDSAVFTGGEQLPRIC